VRHRTRTRAAQVSIALNSLCAALLAHPDTRFRCLPGRWMDVLLRAAGAVGGGGPDPEEQGDSPATEQRASGDAGDDEVCHGVGNEKARSVQGKEMIAGITTGLDEVRRACSLVPTLSVALLVLQGTGEEGSEGKERVNNNNHEKPATGGGVVPHVNPTSKYESSLPRPYTPSPPIPRKESGAWRALRWLRACDGTAPPAFLWGEAGRRAGLRPRLAVPRHVPPLRKSGGLPAALIAVLCAEVC